MDEVTGPPVRVDVVETASAGRIRSLVTAASEVDGVAPLGEQPLRALESDAGSELAHLVALVGDELVGYAQIAGRGGAASVELVVDPAHRRRGIGGELVDAVLRREPGAAVWAHGDLPAAAALARGRGMRPERELVVMGRSLADLPAPPTVDSSTGPEIGRLAEAASEGGERWEGLDARSELLRVNNEAFAWHPEQGGWTREEIDERLAVDWVDPTGILLAVDQSAPRPTLLGFHWTKIHPSGEGEVYVLAVDPLAHGRGLGSRLTIEGLHVLAATGCEAAHLYVEGDNAPAHRTYERLGFREKSRDVRYVTY